MALTSDRSCSRRAGPGPMSASREPATLRIGTVLLKSGYGLVVRMPLGRFQTTAMVTARAVRGKPIGAGKLGRVKTGQPKGYRGPAGDLDLDGIINAFDIDDNGNLTVDNVDRSGRGAGQPVAHLAPAASSLPAAAAEPRDDPSPSPPARSPHPAGAAADAPAGPARAGADHGVQDVLELQARRLGVHQREHPGHRRYRRTDCALRARNRHARHPGHRGTDVHAGRPRQRLLSHHTRSMGSTIRR